MQNQLIKAYTLLILSLCSPMLMMLRNYSSEPQQGHKDNDERARRKHYRCVNDNNYRCFESHR